MECKYNKETGELHINSKSVGFYASDRCAFKAIDKYKKHSKEKIIKVSYANKTITK